MLSRVVESIGRMTKLNLSLFYLFCTYLLFVFAIIDLPTRHPPMLPPVHPVARPDPELPLPGTEAVVAHSEAPA